MASMIRRPRVASPDAPARKIQKAAYTANWIAMVPTLSSSPSTVGRSTPMRMLRPPASSVAAATRPCHSARRAETGGPAGPAAGVAGRAGAGCGGDSGGTSDAAGATTDGAAAASANVVLTAAGTAGGTLGSGAGDGALTF